MGVLNLKPMLFGSFVVSIVASQIVFILFLIPCCLTMQFKSRPLMPNASFLWAWNVPSDSCVGNFSNALDLSMFTLTGSPRKTSIGHPVTIFYIDRLGNYPYINEHHQHIFGGVPQAASLQDHLTKAKTDIEYYIPQDQFGLAIIDWEEWRPTWARNWRTKSIYRTVSIDIVRKRSPGLSAKAIIDLAKKEFELAGRSFMKETLKLGISLRPKHLWGYYLFPDCYNNKFRDPKYNGDCPAIEKARNSALKWMWIQSTALYPSVYLKKSLKSSLQAALYVRFRVLEAIKLSKIKDPQLPLPVFVYIRLVFTDDISNFLLQEDLVHTIGEAISLGADGMVIWGALSITQPARSCLNLNNYMKTTLNPYIINVTLAAKLCAQTLCEDRGMCVRHNGNSSTYLHLNPENFSIGPGASGKLEVHGYPNQGDLRYFSKHFDCTCFAGLTCKKRAKIELVKTVSVCAIKGVCIVGRVEPGSALSLSPGKGLLFLATVTHALYHLQ